MISPRNEAELLAAEQIAFENLAPANALISTGLSTPLSSDGTNLAARATSLARPLPW